MRSRSLVTLAGLAKLFEPQVHQLRVMTVATGFDASVESWGEMGF